MAMALSKITSKSGKIFKGGQAMIFIALFFLVASLSVVLSASAISLSEAKGRSDTMKSRESFFTSESGAEDVLYRVKWGLPVSSTEVLFLNNKIATTTTFIVGMTKEILSIGESNKAIRKSKVIVNAGTGIAFRYGVQAGDGGFILENSSSIQGSVYSNSQVSGSVNSRIYGDVISAGPFGLIDGITATSSAYAHTIKDSKITKDAYYQSLSNTTVGGTFYPNSPDQPTSTLPLDESLIDDWEQEAANGGIINNPCPYIISVNTTIGPKKINCDLEISGTPTITLTGPLWVVGNITTSNSPIIKLDPSLGPLNIPIIADNQSDRSGSGRVLLDNSTEFHGSGTTGSYILVLSRNSSAKNGGAEIAIDARNSITGDLLLYSSEGEVRLENNISLKEVTAYRIRTQNSASVIYATGLASLIFSAGPSGGYTIDSWKETE